MFATIRNIIEGKNGKGGDAGGDWERKKQVAAGVLLLEAAHVDNDFSKEEQAHIVSTLREKFALADDHVAELLKLAEADREESVDLWQFTNLVNRQFSAEEKLMVMEDVWRIILLDGKLEEHEDQYAHKLANLLRLSHEQLIAAKLKARKSI